MSQRSLTHAVLVCALLAASGARGQVVIRAIQADTGNGDVETVESFSFAAPLEALEGGLMLGGDGMMMSNNPLSMLQMKQFVDELAILDDQKDELQSLQREMQKMQSEVYRKIRQPGGRLDMAKFREEMQAMQKVVQERTQQGLKRILVPAQRERLEEIQTQMQLRNRGVSALSGNRLAEFLGLTDEQKEKLASQQGEYKKRLQKGIEELKARLQQEILDDVLTKEQTAKLAKLKGDRYEVKRTSFRDRLEALRKQNADGKGSEEPKDK